MKIPWQALKTQAVQVNIDKLYLLVVPKSEMKVKNYNAPLLQPSAYLSFL
jgi:N-terminal region of Chorein or VPS13